jgi:hypothetical protein
MRTLQEKYNAIQEGKFSKDHFLAEARMQQPQLVTRFNGYDDAVQILKNRGMIVETKVDTETLKDVLRGGKKIATGVRFLNAKDYKDGNKTGTLEKGDQVLDSKETVKEARLTKNNLTDYRYKPTNEMDKYPYEQILRGLRVELEAMDVHGTPTAEEYAKALAKVSKNLAKDPIFYTNQVAGVNPKVDQHDQMVTATAKNTVDTFNGMKKAELKEGFKKLIKKVLSEEVIDVESCKEGVYEMYGAKTDVEYKRELENYLEDNQIYGYTDMLFDILTSPEEEAVADNLADFLDDHQIYGYNRGLLAIFRDYANRNYPDNNDLDESAMGDIYQIAQEHDRFEHFVQAVEDEFGPVEDIAELEHIFNATRGEDDINYGNENFSDAEIDTEYEGDPGYQGYESPSDRAMKSDAWVQAQRDMMEGIDTEADKNMVRKLMDMYETDPSKFEKLHKQAKVQADTTSGIQFKKLEMLFQRAKAGALQKATPEIPGFEGTRDALDNLFESVSLKDLL